MKFQCCDIQEWENKTRQIGMAKKTIGSSTQTINLQKYFKDAKQTFVKEYIFCLSNMNEYNVYYESMHLN